MKHMHILHPWNASVCHAFTGHLCQDQNWRHPSEGGTATVADSLSPRYQKGSDDELSVCNGLTATSVLLLSASFFPQHSDNCHPLTLSSASSSLAATNFMSCLTTSISLLFGLPLGLLPGCSILSTSLPIYAQSLSQIGLSHFTLKNMCCSSDVLVPVYIDPCPSKKEPHHFLIHDLQQLSPVLCSVQLSKPVPHFIDVLTF